MPMTSTWNRMEPAFEKAIIAVLKQARKPLTIREILDILLEKHLIKSSGKTPDKTLYAIIRRRNERAAAKGEKSPFNRIKRHISVSYTLNK